MRNDYNARGKKPDGNIPNIDDPLVMLEESIINHFNTSDYHSEKSIKKKIKK